MVGEVMKVFEDIKIEEAKKVIQEEEKKQRKILVPFSDVLYEPLKMKLASDLATEKGMMIKLSRVFEFGTA